MECINTLQAAADAAHALGGPDALITYLLQANVNQLLHPSGSSKEEVNVSDDVCAHCLSPLTPHAVMETGCAIRVARVPLWMQACK
jgi:predicted HD phosphohydrolase